jgi:hypothetical protein
MITCFLTTTLTASCICRAATSSILHPRAKKEKKLAEEAEKNEPLSQFASLNSFHRKKVLL